jgi:hypothetical protein
MDEGAAFAIGWKFASGGILEAFDDGLDVSLYARH